MEVRYTALANAIVKQISENKLAIGSQMPSELALAKKYNVSRTTVRSALNIVEGLGLITRKRRAGTVVIANETTNNYTKSLNNIEDLINYASQTVRKIIHINDVVCDEELAAALECKPGQKWLHVQMLRTENNKQRTPICWTDVYISPKEGHQIVDDIEDGFGLLCNLIEKRSGRAVSSVRQQITAVAIPENIAILLNASDNAPGLEITRHYLDQGKQSFLITVSKFPAETFKYTFWLHRAKSPTI